MTTQTGKTVIQNINLGGISDSRYSGVEGSVADIFCLDIHEEPGIIKAQQGTENDIASGDTMTQDAVAIITASNNLTYLFGKNGTVYTRNSSSVYTELGSIPSGSAYGVINDAYEFGGDLYYTMQERVGKYTPGDVWNTSTVDGTQNNFKNITFDSFHPMVVIENDLYVGHTYNIGKITPTETAGGDITDVLDFDTEYTVESLADRRSRLVIGTRKSGAASGSFAGFSRIFEWDLVSPSWNAEQEVAEFGISAFMTLSGALLFNAGPKGMLYSWDGANAQQFKRIPGDWSGDNRARIYKNAVSAYDSRLAFGISNENGNPVKQGVWTLGGYDAKYPSVFNLEFIQYNGTSTGTEVFAIERVSTDLIFSTDDGISKVDTTNKYSGGYFVTREINIDRDNQKAIKARVCYRTLNGQTIEIRANVNNADPTFTGAALTTLVHDNKKYLETANGIMNANTLQFQIKVSATGGLAPETENLTILT